MSTFFGTTNLPSSPPSKEACSQALTAIPLRPTLQEVSEAATLFQFRKCFSAGELDEFSEFQKFCKQAGKPNRTPSAAFQEAACHAVDLLPSDWDSGYSSYVEKTVPKFTANLEKITPAALPLTPDMFRDVCHGRVVIPPELFPTERTFLSFMDSGKARNASIPTFLQLLLGPASDCLYNALVRTRAVHLGPVTSSSFAGMKSKEGEVFCSGDYQASTTNFERLNTLFLINRLRLRSTRIPDSIWDLMEKFMGEINVTSKFGSILMANTQLMGDRPSFSLLCLTNLTGVILGLGINRTRTLIKRGLLKINGDDIVFRATPAQIHQWKESLPQAGLVLETTKTLLHPTVLTLNSTFLRARATRSPRMVWFYRASSFHATVLPNGQQKATSPSFRSSRAARWLTVVQDSLKGLTSPRTSLLRFHLLRSRPSLVYPLPSSLRVSLGDTRRLPPPLRPHLSSLPLANRLRYRASPVDEKTTVKTSYSPPTSGFEVTNQRPTTRREWAEHRQITQYLGFQRRRVVPVQPLLSHPSQSDPSHGQDFKSRYGHKSLPKWSVPLYPVSSLRRQGVGWASLDQFYRSSASLLSPPPPPPLVSGILTGFVPRSAMG